ncbi:hypothetical protein OC846_004319 [Tilletia horrida]|uniref:Uncharacterized protein n=1 Tax=Tilletia horrida TaxID=155126 RepID=A0AAN6JR84_9BASI|nr:hypothetical protein OC846_004319 [Tilletia horrida]KAK0564042.1 hypothetical protein OC861_004502 [Tilletia horrida]
MSASPRFVSTLKESKVVIIGGTSGIGLAVASGVIEEGGSVIVASSSAAKVNHAVVELSDPAKQYNADPTRVRGISLELGGPETEARVTAFFEQVGAFDHLIITAGRVPRRTLTGDQTWDTLNALMTERLTCAFLTVKVAAYGKYLKEGGSVTLTTGSLYRYPMPGASLGVAVTGAIVSLVRGLALDLSGRSIRVNAVSPGPLRTSLFEALPKEFQELMTARLLTGRPGEVDHVVQTYLSLLKSPSVTGETLNDDSGGYSVKQPAF